MTTLVAKVAALADALSAAAVPYAFGGALALAYCTEDPRGTRDVDVNAFVPASRPDPVLSALPPGVAVPTGTAQRLAADGQVRLWWEDTPVDLFLSYAPLHDQAFRGRRLVPFAGGEVWVLGAVEVVLFKALFDRSKDWVDVEAVLQSDAVDQALVRSGLIGLVGADDPRLARWDALVRDAPAP